MVSLYYCAARCRALILLVLSCFSWQTQAASTGSINYTDGRSDWIIVWKKGVDGAKMFQQLCPVVTVGDPAAEDSEGFPAAVQQPLPIPLLTATGLPAIHCTAQFTSIINGLAGERRWQEPMRRTRAPAEFGLRAASLPCPLGHDLTHHQRSPSWHTTSDPAVKPAPSASHLLHTLVATGKLQASGSPCKQTADACCRVCFCMLRRSCQSPTSHSMRMTGLTCMTRPCVLPVHITLSAAQAASPPRSWTLSRPPTSPTLTTSQATST